MRSQVLLILRCPAIEWSWFAMMISLRSLASFGIYVRFFHLTNLSCFVQWESFLFSSSFANRSNLYWRLIIREVILVEVTALMEIEEEGGEKRELDSKVWDLLSNSTPFSKSGLLDRGSAGLVFPEWWEITRWYSWRICCYCAWWQNRSCGLWKNSRFLWSVNISMRWDASRR